MHITFFSNDGDNSTIKDVANLLIIDNDGKTIQYACTEAKDGSIIMAHEPDAIAHLMLNNFENVELIEDGPTTDSEAGRHDTEMGC